MNINHQYLHIFLQNFRENNNNKSPTLFSGRLMQLLMFIKPEMDYTTGDANLVKAEAIGHLYNKT